LGVLKGDFFFILFAIMEDVIDPYEFIDFLKYPERYKTPYSTVEQLSRTVWSFRPHFRTEISWEWDMAIEQGTIQSWVRLSGYFFATDPIAKQGRLVIRFLLASHKGRGLGTQLMQRVDRMLTESSNAWTITWHPFNIQNKAQRFWSRLRLSTRSGGEEMHRLPALEDDPIEQGVQEDVLVNRWKLRAFSYQVLSSMHVMHRGLFLQEAQDTTEPFKARYASTLDEELLAYDIHTKSMASEPLAPLTLRLFYNRRPDPYIGQLTMHAMELDPVVTYEGDTIAYVVFLNGGRNYHTTQPTHLNRALSSIKGMTPSFSSISYPPALQTYTGIMGTQKTTSLVNTLAFKRLELQFNGATDIWEPKNQNIFDDYNAQNIRLSVLKLPTPPHQRYHIFPMRRFGDSRRSGIGFVLYEDVKEKQLQIMGIYLSLRLE